MHADDPYRAFDVRPVLARLFYPRRQEGRAAAGEPWPVPTVDGTELGCLWFDARSGASCARDTRPSMGSGRSSASCARGTRPSMGSGRSSASCARDTRPSMGSAVPTILFFHGNGEIAADYADVGPLLNARGISLLVAEYRGYGASEGTPTVAAMMADARAVFELLERRLPACGGGPVVVMGRSLGSAPAVDLAVALGPPRVAGLVVESGFARAKPLLRTLGVSEQALVRIDGVGLDNVDKIRTYPGPTLVIHGAQDHLIPVGDGQALYEAAPAACKDLLVVPRADHNSLFAYGLDAYLDAVERLVRAAVPPAA
jgi:alpha-beta hydrolase superfamily lysophospholipase